MQLVAARTVRSQETHGASGGLAGADGARKRGTRGSGSTSPSAMRSSLRMGRSGRPRRAETEIRRHALDICELAAPKRAPVRLCADGGMKVARGELAGMGRCGGKEVASIRAAPLGRASRS